jgi:hypothetical protein
MIIVIYKPRLTDAAADQRSARLVRVGGVRPELHSIVSVHVVLSHCI